MPIYEYRRPDGTTFEVQQSFTDEPLERDPDSGVPVTRVLHAPALHFKGTGFYNTDYGTRNRERELAAKDNGDGKDGAGKDSKGDSSAAASSASDAAGKDGASGSPAGDGVKGKPGADAAGKGSAKAKRGKSPASD